MKKELSEIEEDFEKMQKSKVYLQGLAKNNNIICNHRVTIQKHQQKINIYMTVYTIILQICQADNAINIPTNTRHKSVISSFSLQSSII